MSVARATIRRITAIGSATVVVVALTGPPAGVFAATSDGLAGPPKGGSRAGVSRRVVKLGMHAPLTGAVPLPGEATDEAKDIYFRWLRANDQTINGRRVEVVLRNDNYNPGQAVEACKELVREERVFALVGFTGIDQMQACAGYAASAHVPYISPGGTERRMDLPQTFATTMTWPDQGPLMADFMITRLKARKRGNAIVWYDTVNYKRAQGRFVTSMRKRDADVFSRSAPAQANAADATTIVQELAARDIENVYVLVTPTFFMQLLNAASQRDYRPLWTGIDPRVQTDEFAGIGCRENAPRARFFSPYPALGDRDRFDEKFDRAMNRLHPNEEADETHWGNWAQQKVIARLLRLPGRNLTRSRFVYFAERARRIKTGIGPRLRFRPKNHFGARQVHLNRLDCDEEEWQTEKAFVGDFKRKRR